MNCSPTISAESFKQLHNGLWELDRLVDDLGNEKLAKVANLLRESLSEAYEQDSKAFETKSDHYNNVRTQLGLQSVWSIYEVDNLSDRHPFEGADRVVYKDHWGETPIQCSINGLTWAALYMAADSCIRDSGDKHHIYIEIFQPAKDDPRTLILSTGS